MKGCSESALSRKVMKISRKDASWSNVSDVIRWTKDDKESCNSRLSMMEV